MDWLRHSITPPLLTMLTIAGWALGGTAFADTKDAGAAPNQLTAIDEHLMLFDRICLRAFPDDRTLEAEAKANSMSPMSSADIQKFMSTDPGKGWYYKASGTTFLYAITVEAPPYQACTVRRIYAGQPAFDEHYQTTLSNWAAADKGTQLGPKQQKTAERDGHTVTATQQGLARNGKLAEILVSAASKLPNGMVEIRFVRQIPIVQ